MTAEKPPLSNQGETSREAVTDRLARLDDYGKLELFSTCHNCAKWQEVLFADNEHCIKPKVAKSRLLHENPDRRAVEGISKPKERTQ